MADSLTVLCTYFEGRDHRVPSFSRVFSPEWADRLYRACVRNIDRPFRFVCMTHVEPERFEERDIRVVPFIRDSRDWMCIIESFRADLGPGRRVWFGLDTVILRDLDALVSWDGDFGMVRNPWHATMDTLPQSWQDNFPTRANPLVAWDAEAGAHLWEKYIEKPDYWNAHCRFPGCVQPSEMVYIGQEVECDVVLLDDIYPREFASYKCQVLNDRTLLDDVSVVYFHGSHKPHEVYYDEPWMWEAWR